MRRLYIDAELLKCDGIVVDGEVYDMLLKDKVIYSYIKQNWDKSQKKGLPYKEAQTSIAKALGVNYHAINRFVRSACEIGILQTSKQSVNDATLFENVKSLEYYYRKDR